jgi:hypothetical protein
MPWAKRWSHATVVATECEAFLAGAHVELLLQLGQRVPSAAWLNPLAHGDADRLATLAAGRWDELPSGYFPWERVVIFLAGEVLDTAERLKCDLVDLQRSRLIPLELDLLGRPESSLVEPRQLVSMVRARLQTRPSIRRRR